MKQHRHVTIIRSRYEVCTKITQKPRRIRYGDVVTCWQFGFTNNGLASVT